MSMVRCGGVFRSGACCGGCVARAQASGYVFMGWRGRHHRSLARRVASSIIITANM